MGGQTGEHGLKVMPRVSQQGHVIILQVSDKGLQLKFPAVPNKLGIVEICNSNTSIHHLMADKGHSNDGIEVEVEKIPGALHK